MLVDIEPGFELGCEHFDRREYFEAHEVWESIWMGATGARHAFLQCLIQVAVGLHHASNGNIVGARKLLASSLGYMDKGRSECAGANLDKLTDCILEFELGMQKQEAGGTEQLPFFKLPR